MYRLKNTATLRLLLCLAFLSAACATAKPVVRDQLAVEKLRLRITKVRNAVAETRAVIAASRGAPYLPELLMRLAELMSEEARYHYMVAYEREQRRTKSLHVPQVRFLKEQAIGTYRSILKRYPGTHLADRILFNISQELRELGQFDEMRTSLEQLVNEHPDSPYRTEALLVLGDFHFDKTEFAAADKYYRQITSQEQNPLLGLAYYKLAWVNVNLGNCKRALEQFEKAITSARRTVKAAPPGAEPGSKPAEPSTPQDFAVPDLDDQGRSFAGHKAVDVQREALVDLTYCYAQERKPEEAVAYLRGLASTREAYVAALSKMANRYALIEQPRGAAEVAREILRLAPDEEERLDDARMLHSAISRMKDYSAVGEDVSLILRALRRQLLRPDLDAAAGALLKNEFEMIARDLATKAHEMLQDPSKGTKWTKEPATALMTARAYSAYLDALPDSRHRLEIVLNLADVLMDGNRFLDSGHRYQEAAEILSKPLPQAETDKGPPPPEPLQETPAQKSKRNRDRRDALYNAVVAYQKSLESEGARGHLERTLARAGLRKAGGQYLSMGDPSVEKAKRIKFAIAQSYYDEGNYKAAIDLLTAVAYEYPKTQQGDAAVHMVLDSYRTINDVSGLISVGRRFLGAGSPINPQLRTQIQPIVEAAQQRRLDELSLVASGEQVGGMEMLLAFADRYKGTDLGERALLSAFVAARAGGDTAQLYAMGEKVISQFPGSNQVAGVLSTMGRTAAARFEFDRAISYLEQAAEKSEEQRASLLLTAGELREQLADKPGALSNYNKALSAAGEGPRRSEAIAHISDLMERDGTSAEIVATLTPLSRTPDPEVSSRLGMALMRTGRYDEAEEHLRSVVEGAAAASPSAQARANYGIAEIMLHMLETFTPPPELDAIEEAIGLVDVVLQAYLAAARQPDPVYSQAALARLARAAEVGADKIESIQLPPELSPEDRDLVMQAMKKRADQLRRDRDEVLADCAQRARASYLLDEAGQACIKRAPPVKDPVRFRFLKPRKKALGLKGVDQARDNLSKNPDDLEALRTVGKAFMDAGDSHAARLVLARTVEAGGGADDLNLMGIASYQAGDLLGALDAFGRAKEAGSGDAALNLAAVCSELGLKSLSNDILKEARPGGTGNLLRTARALRATTGGGK